jgi:hypothetical protein
VGARVIKGKQVNEGRTSRDKSLYPEKAGGKKYAKK